MPVKQLPAGVEPLAIVLLYARAHVVQVEHLVRVAVYRTSDTEAESKIKVFSAPTFESLIHATYTVEQCGTHPYAVARRAT